MAFLVVSLSSFILSLILLLSFQHHGGIGGSVVSALVVIPIDANNGNDSLCLPVQQRNGTEDSKCYLYHKLATGVIQVK